MTYHSIFKHFIVELCPNLLHYDNYTVTLIVYEIQQTVQYCTVVVDVTAGTRFRDKKDLETLARNFDGGRWKVGVMLQSRGIDRISLH